MGCSADRRPEPRSLILASASPARLRTLRAAGIDARVMVSGVDEAAIVASASGTLLPAQLSVLLAGHKADAVAARIRDTASAPEALVLGCDSIFELDGRGYGKPRDPAEATARWRRMSGRSGVLHTGHALLDLGSGRRAEGVGSATVFFGELTDDEIAAYVATGEPLHVAGAFTIDGFGGPFVEQVRGDPHTVVGLSLPLLRQLLSRVGACLLDLWPEGD